jgi:hypothetical protein
MMLIGRRSFLAGLGSLIAAPAVVRAASLMPVRAPKLLLGPPNTLVVPRGSMLETWLTTPRYIEQLFGAPAHEQIASKSGDRILYNGQMWLIQ